MASRHDIIHIDFQANAGKANVALQALQSEAEKARQKVESLRTQLQNARNANLPLADIQKLEQELAKASKESKQWQSALNNNMKGVRALDEAIKMFNKGKGTVEDMNAALSKTALNAAQLQKSRSADGSKTWKEMDALIVALQQNIAKCNTAMNSLVSTIKNGGTASKNTLMQAKTDLQQMIALEEQGSKGWVKYNSQLKTVEGELNRLTAIEQQAAGKNALAQVFRGDYLTKSKADIEQLITKVKEYQSTIQDPKGAGYRHFAATETALKKLSEQLAKTKGDVATVQQALKAAGAAGMANRFGGGLEAQGHKIAQAYRKTTEALNQLQQKRQTYTIIQQNGLSLTAQEQAMLAKLDTQIAATTARQEKLRAEMIKVGEAQNLSTQQISQSITLLRQQQEVVAAGSPAWKKYEAAINSLDERMKIMRGEAMSLFDAMRLSTKAGGQGFTGTAKQLQLAQQAIEKAAAAAKKGSPEWQKYQQALAKVRVEMNNASMTSERMRTVIAQPANAKNLNELSAAVKRAKAELDLMAGTVGKTSKAYTDLAAQTKKAEIQMKQMQAQSHGTASAWDKAVSRLKTYIGLYVGAAVAMQKIVSTMGDIMELSDRMGEVRKTTGFTADEVGRLSDNLKKMDVRTPLTELMEVSAAAGQLGLKTIEDVQGFTEAANKLMIAMPEMGKEAATQMMRVAIATGEVDKIRKQMQEGLIEGSSATAVAMEKIASTIDRLRASSASTAPEITDFVKRLGAVGAQSGITIDQVAALGSTVSSLGMRVEMSATALSRMIPAIKNNAFAVAKAIGVTPDTLRSLFDAGRGMEAILMIFQHIRDAGMNEDSIEQMLGMHGMQEVMKELNQMGARAGIVFAGLSQNVDELRRQLGVADQAYEENIAIQQEFEKMNETTAARWARLKNQFEEFFIGNEAQSWLGGVIDGLRAVIDLLTGNGGWSQAIRAVTIAWSMFKLGLGEAFWKYIISNIIAVGKSIMTLGTTMTTVKTKWIASWKAMDAATKTNWIMAIIAAVYLLGKAIWDAATKVSELDKALNELDNETDDAVRHVTRLMTAFNDAGNKVNETTKKHEQLKNETEKLRKEVDELKKSTDNSTEAHDKLKKKEDELEKAEKELKKAEDESNKANGERSKLISEINSKYSTYLGYMLNEKTAAEQVASAHQLIIAALKEERKQKGLNAMHDAVDKEYAEDMKEYTEDSQSNLKDISRNAQRRVMDQWRRVMTAVTYDADNDRYTLSGVQGVTKGGTYGSEKELKAAMRSALREIIKTEAADKSGNISVSTWAGKGIKSIDTYLNDIWGNSIDDGFGDWAETYIKRERDIMQATHDNQVETSQAHKETVEKAVADMNSNMNALVKTSQKNEKFTDDQIRQMAQNVNAIVASFEKYGSDMQHQEDNRNKIYGEGKEETLQNAVNNLLDNLDKNTRARVLRVAQQGRKSTTGTGNVSTNITSPWGSNPEAESTDWKNMSAEVLVNRRKQMKDFVNAIQTDTDVQAVLKEDAALKKAIEAGMSSDMRTVIEWYNTERLKIQDELNARHLTNTGDWKDPKQEKARKERLHSEWKAYIDELDAYYTERKARIQESYAEEGISEKEAQNRTIANEAEWRQRRMELQKMYAQKAGEVTQEEQEAIFRIISERTGDDVKFVKATYGQTLDFMKKIGEKSPLELKKAIGKLDLDIERDGLKLQQTVAKQVKAIQDIIDKERPFNSITKNLRENLETMDILAGHMRKEYEELLKTGGDMTDFNNRQAAEQLRELTFILGEAENAYSTTIAEVTERMRKEGMTAWADWLQVNPKAQEGLMAQLRQTYDQIQDAIKKEASQMKKQAEIMWNNILLPGSDPKDKTTIKDAFEKAIAQLGIDQGRVSRANSMIGAGQASERVADKLAIKQMQLQLTMQQHYYNLMRKQGKQRIDDLQRQIELAEKDNDLQKAKQLMLDKQHAEMSLNLATTKEQTDIMKQQEDIIARTEESQARLYKELREWGDLIASSLQSVMEASNAGNAEYYNELAKLNLTGKGGPGAGTYIVIENEGTEDAKAHYEYLDERQALERQREIEQQNAQADAWKKVMDDLNQKMNDTITDQLNAMLQNQSIDANTAALNTLTGAINNLTGTIGGQPAGEGFTRNSKGFAVDSSGQMISPIQPTAPSKQPTEGMPKPMCQMSEEELAKADENIGKLWTAYKEYGIAAETEKAEALAEVPGYVPPITSVTDEQIELAGEKSEALAQKEIDASRKKTDAILADQQAIKQGEIQTDSQMTKSSKNMYAAMISAANLYGVAYQAVTNENLDAEQKFQMIAVQAAGQAAMTMMTAKMYEAETGVMVSLPEILAKCLSNNPIAGAAIFAVLSALLGAAIGVATSKLAKGKAEVAAVTGASMGAGRLSTGMLTYAEGNVNEFTDPNSLTPGRSYNVDAADGKTYRAKYTGANPSTHLTNGPEFHLAGEAGREMIIDAGTTRQITMNDGEIWHAIQTLSAGGRMHRMASRRRGVRAFAEGNVDDFEEMTDGGYDIATDATGFGGEQMAAFQSSIDKNNELLERALTEGIHAKFDVYGKGGLVDSYDTGKKNVTRHGERY